MGLRNNPIDRITTVSATGTLSPGNELVLCDNAADITVTLPLAANSRNHQKIIKKTGNNANIVTIDGNGSNINGVSTLILYILHDEVTIVCDGTAWHIVSNGLQIHQARMSRDAAQSLSDGVDTKIAFDTETYDIGGIADAVTNDRFTIRRSGKYLVKGTVSLLLSTSGNNIRCYIYKNGSMWRRSTESVGAGAVTVAAVCIDNMDLVTGDYIEMYAQQVTAAVQNTPTAIELKPIMTITESR